MNDTLALIFLYKIGLTLVAASWALLESPTHSPPAAECPGADQAPHLAQPPGLNTPRVTLLPGGVNWCDDADENTLTLWYLLGVGPRTPVGTKILRCSRSS